MAHLLLYSSYENGMGRKEKDEAAAAAERHRGVEALHGGGRAQT
jgi:hypothetical protein